MPSYTYQCVTDEGSQRDGVVIAVTLSQARQQLEERGWRVLELTQMSSGQAVVEVRSAKGSDALREALADADALTTRPLPTELDTLPLRSLSMFMMHLGLLITAGFSFARSLTVLSESQDLEASRIAGSLLRGVESGLPLSVAMARHPAVFTPSIVLLMRFGERSGRVPEVLQKLADALRKQEERRNRLTSMLMYPLCVLVATIAMLAFLVYSMLPGYVKLFAESGATMPALTANLLALSANPLPIVLGTAGLAGFVGVFLAAPRSHLCHRIAERLKYRGPVRGMFRISLVATLCQNLAMLTGSGVAVVDALNAICEGGTGWSEADRMLRQALAQVRNGLSLSSALGTWPLFPQVMVGAVATGETTGHFPEMLRLVAGLFEEQVDHRVDQLGRALEPMVLLLMGVGVAFVVLAAFLPVFQLARSF